MNQALSQSTIWTSPENAFSGTLLSPAELEVLRQSLPQSLRPPVHHRWQLLSQVPAALLAALDTAVHFTSGHVQTSSNGVHYGIFNLQVQDRQHRFVTPVCMPGFVELITALGENRVDMLLGTADGAIVKTVAMDGEKYDATSMPRVQCSIAENANPHLLTAIANEVPLLIDHLVKCSALPSLNGKLVRHVSLASVLPPAVVELLKRENGARRSC